MPPVKIKCVGCGITLRVPGTDYCSVCDSILESIQRPFFVNAHVEWNQENIMRIRLKNMMLNAEHENKA